MEPTTAVIVASKIATTASHNDTLHPVSRTARKICVLRQMLQEEGTNAPRPDHNNKRLSWLERPSEDEGADETKLSSSLLRPEHKRCTLRIEQQQVSHSTKVTLTLTDDAPGTIQQEATAQLQASPSSSSDKGYNQTTEAGTTPTITHKKATFHINPMAIPPVFPSHYLGHGCDLHLPKPYSRITRVLSSPRRRCTNVEQAKPETLNSTGPTGVRCKYCADLPVPARDSVYCGGSIKRPKTWP